MGTTWPPNLSEISGPKYLALVQSLRQAINSNELCPGDRLPPVRELAWQLKITPGTVARAYRKATDDGILQASVGRGTFVADTSDPSPVNLASPLLIVEEAGDCVDLRGSKNPALGQDQHIQNALKHLARQPEPAYILHPRIDSDLAGRQAVCDWLRYTDIRATPQDVTLTYGAQNSVLVALQTLLKGPNPAIVTDDLVFPGMRHAARLQRAQTISIGRDKQGVLPEELENICRHHGPQVFLTSTNAHNPTTWSTSLERRLEIAKVAEKYDLQIIDDDAYGTFSSEVPSLREIARSRVWYAGSLSKSFASGLRFGFLVAPPGKGALARGIMQSGSYGMSQPLVDLATQIISAGIAEETRLRINQFNRQRVQIAVNNLGRWDLSWNDEVPFLWLQLPIGWRSSSFLRECDRNGVLLFAADQYALFDGKAPNAVRIAIGSNYSEADFERALRVISDLLENPPLSTEI